MSSNFTTDIKLTRNQGFVWTKFKDSYVKGYMLSDNLVHLKESSLIDYLSSFESIQELLASLRHCAGEYSAVIKKDKVYWLISDPGGSMPLFWKKSEQTIIVSDDCFMANNGTYTLDDESLQEFDALGFVSESKTLVKDVFQTLAHHVVEIKETAQITYHRYYDHSTSELRSASFEESKQLLHDELAYIFAKFIQTLEGRTVALPLSGGYDSRLLAIMLKEHNYKDVFCFTYGRKGNVEVENARKVADTLGYPWQFIEYNDELIEGYLEDDVFQDYYPFAANGRSMPFMQDYFAVKYLKNNNLIPDNSIFIPGHCADSIAGTRLKGYRTDEPNISAEALAKEMLDEHYVFKKLNRSEQNHFLKKLIRNISLYDGSPFSYSIYEDWDFTERQSKFLTNSASVFDFFGYEYRLPFWHLDFLDFFKKTPFEWKKHKKLYKATLQKFFFEKYDLNLESETQVSAQTWKTQQIKNKIKKHFPTSVNQHFMRKRDAIFYPEITAKMEEEMIQANYPYRRADFSFNSIIVQWYLYKISCKNS